MNFAWVSRIRRRAGLAGFGIAILLAAALLDGCYVYGPPYPPEPAYYASTSFGRSWNAALDAMEDVGARIVSADHGGRGGAHRVGRPEHRDHPGDPGRRRRHDHGPDTGRRARAGGVQLEEPLGPGDGPDKPDGLTNQMYQAYERRMGR